MNYLVSEGYGHWDQIERWPVPKLTLVYFMCRETRGWLVDWDTGEMKRPPRT